MADRQQRRQYPPEFQLEAVRLADSIGLNVAADRLGVPRATIGNWTRRRRKAGYPLDGQAATSPDAGAVLKRPAAELEAENARLRRELASQRLDNEILPKAAA